MRLNLLHGLGSVFKPFVLSGTSNKDEKNLLHHQKKSGV